MSVVLVTGCGSGIGFCTALTFARRGDRIYAGLRDLTRRGELESAASRQALELRICRLDVTSDSSVEQAVKEILTAERGRLDVLVNNAGISHFGAVETMPDELVRSVFETNLFGPLRLVRAVLPAMRAQRSGAIVNVSSAGGRAPGMPTGFAYGASKHALGVMSESLAVEVAGHGIRVACIEPGYFASRLTEGVYRGAGEGSPYHELENQVIAAIVAGTTSAPHPQPVADAIVKAAYEEGPLHVLVGADAEALCGSGVAYRQQAD